MQKISPFLWFDANAEEAVAFYTSVFRNSKVTGIARYGEAGPGPSGSVMTISFQLEGQDFVALNGGPQFKFNESISFVIDCASQEELDSYWEKLLAGGGQTQACGWLKDKFGVSWQVVPRDLWDMIKDPNPERQNRVMKAMLDMVKLDLAKLREAYGRSG